MTYIAPDTETHRIVRGVDTDVTHRVYLADESIPTIVAGSSQAVVYDGAGDAVTSALSVTWTSSTATLTATVPGADTTGATLAASPWSIQWTVGDGSTTEVHERRARLVRRVVPPALLSDDLTDRYPELADHRTTADLREDIAEAWDDLQTDLEVRGVLVDQITSPAWLYRAHYLRAGHAVYGKLAEDSGDERWGMRSRELGEHYRAHLSDGIPYDADQDDVEDTAQATASDERWFWRTGRVS